MRKDINKKLSKQNRKNFSRNRKIAIIGTLVVITILIGVYIAFTVTATQEKYWKPQKEFQMPDVNWSAMKSGYILKRNVLNLSSNNNPEMINQTIGSENIDGDFKVEITVDICCYIYIPNGFDSIRTSFCISFTKLSGNYIVKDLIFKYDPSDGDVRTPSFDDYYFAAKNLYFTADMGNYPTPYGTVSDKMDYELWSLHRICGINKDEVDIKNGGFSNSFQIDLYDSTTSGENHSITLHAILHYGKYVHGLLGANWEDVHTLDANVVIYIVPEKG